jgi:fructokinase
MDRPLIFGIGEIVWDCLPEGKKLGGAPVNFAYYAGKLGAESYPVSAVGSDDLGKETLSCCKNFGLDTRFIEVNDLPTSRVLVTLDNDGVPQYEIIQGVAWDSLNASEEVLRSISGADAICWGSLAGRSDQSFRAINEILKAAPEDSMKVFDINIRQNYYTNDKIDSSLNIASVLKLNEDELPIISKMFSLPAKPQDALKEIALRWNLQYVIYTCGAAFSEIHSQTGLLSHIPTPKVKVADTVGAGDSFTAAFVTSILLGKSAEESHQTAVSLAAKVCSRPGAIIEL